MEQQLAELRRQTEIIKNLKKKNELEYNEGNLSLADSTAVKIKAIVDNLENEGIIFNGSDEHVKSGYKMSYTGYNKD